MSSPLTPGLPCSLELYKEQLLEPVDLYVDKVFALIKEIENVLDVKRGKFLICGPIRELNFDDCN